MKKVLYITIIGAPNVGKSSLINCITNMSFCTVSSKGHTSKQAIYTILNIKDTQLIFVDTPGLSQENTGKFGYLNKISIGECNVIENAPHIILFLIEAHKPIPPHIEYLIQKYTNKLKIVIMTKVDKKHHDQYLLNTTQIKEHVNDVFITSSYTNKGIDTLLNYLLTQAKEMEWPFSQTFKTNISESTLIRDRIREACFEYLYQEIPHEIGIEYKIIDDQCDVTLLCTTSQKSIILQYIKQISMLSRQKVKVIVPHIKSLYIYVKAIL